MKNLINNNNAIYEVIENELVNNNIIKGLEISGSLFSLTTFKNTTFESCVFFGSRIENSNFINCTFVNCKFQFSNLESNNFKATSFKDCTWELTPIRNSVFEYCFLDTRTAFSANKDNNEFISCSSEKALSWENILQGNQGFESEKIQEEEQGSSLQSFIDATCTMFQELKKAA